MVEKYIKRKEEYMEKQVIIITGAARGIGKEIAKMLAKNGHIVICNYNNSKEQAMELKKELEKEGKQIEIFQADISKQEECKKLVNFTLEKYHRIDGLINNAGIDKIQLFHEETKEDWNRIMDTNLFGAFCMCQQVAKNMIQNQKGWIINISSIWGQVGASMEVIYSISKAGMDGMTKALAKELGPSGIRVNSIAPGIIQTDMNAGLTEKSLRQIEEEIPLGKIGKAKAIADCVKWLIEDNYTTGQVISINGGWVIT